MERPALIDEIASQIAAIIRPHPVRVAIDGVDAAGKTTFADELAPVLAAFGRPVIRASIDGFHNPATIRYRRGALSPEGYFHDSFNYPALVEVLLQPLGPGGSLAFRRAVFDFRTDAIVDAPLERAEPNAILLLDGVFLLRPELRTHFDFSIFLRSVEEVRRRYRVRYIPGQQLYLREAQPERFASVIIGNDHLAGPILKRARQ